MPKTKTGLSQGPCPFPQLLPLSWLDQSLESIILCLVGHSELWLTSDIPSGGRILLTSEERALLGELGHERHLELKKVTWGQRWQQGVSKKLDRMGNGWHSGRALRLVELPRWALNPMASVFMREEKAREAH